MKSLLICFDYFESRYQPISRKYLTENLLATKCRDGTTALKTVILNADNTSLTTGSWTSNSTEDFVTVTLLVLLVHVLSDWVLSCYVLDTAPLSLAHTAGNLSAHLTSVVQKWSIKDELLYVTTDNATNIVKGKSTTTYFYVYYLLLSSVLNSFQLILSNCTHADSWSKFYQFVYLLYIVQHMNVL